MAKKRKAVEPKTKAVQTKKKAVQTKKKAVEIITDQEKFPPATEGSEDNLLLEHHPEITARLESYNITGISTRSKPGTSSASSVVVESIFVFPNKQEYKLSSKEIKFPVVNFTEFSTKPDLLLSIGNYDIAKEKTIQLPKLCLHAFKGTRLKTTTKNSIHVLYREWMSKFIDYCIASGMPDGRIIALTGPKGIGKSFTLYLLCAQLRQDGYRVLYLPSLLQLASSFKSVGLRSNLSNELYFAFPDEGAKSIISEYEKNEKVTLEETILLLKNIYYNDSKVKGVVLIFDQLNTIHNKKHRNDVEEFLQSLANQIPIVVSFSANCNVETNVTYYNTYQAVDFELKEAEMKAFIKTVDPDTEYSDKEMKAVFDVTGGSPLGVVEVIREKASSIDEKIAQFKVNALTGYEADIYKFADERKEKTAMINSAMLDILLLNGRFSKLNLNELFFDKKIIQKIYRGSEQFQYKIVNAIAWNAMWNYLKNTIKSENIDDEACKVFESSRTATAKGCELEYYIITRSLITSKLIISPELSFNDFAFQFFSVGNLSGSLFSDKVLVLLPISENNPVNDLYVYVPKGNDKDSKAKIYGVQITIQKTVHQHYKSMMDQLADGKSQFSVFLYSLSKCFGKNEAPNYYQIYITKEEKGVNSKLRYYSTNFNSMKNNYPALIKLNKS